MKPSDLSHLNQPSDPQLSPDGGTVAFVVSTPDMKEDRYTKRIWFSDATGSRPVSDGPEDTNPRWSPDGKHLAFIRKLDDDGKQVGVVDLDTENVTILTNFQLGVEAVEWSPDGSRLVAVVISHTEEWADLDDDERERRPRSITSVPFMFDNKGALFDRRRHLWLLDVSGDVDPVCLTPGEFHEEYPAWSPDGETIAFITDRDPRQGLESGNDVFEVDISTGDVSRALPRGFWQTASYGPDGRLHALGSKNPRYPGNAYLHRREEDGSLTDMTSHLDRSAVSLAAGPARIAWNDDVAVVGIEDSGTFGVIAVGRDGDIQTLSEGRAVVTGFDAHEDKLVTTASRWDSPGEVFENGEPITSLNSSDIGTVEPEHFRVRSDDVEVDVWVYLPDGDGDVPVLLNIHGGPASQYGFGFFDEFHVYAGAGYGVIACNPRGSSGRGTEYVEAVKGDAWGEVDLADIRAAVAAALERFPRLDRSRMGIMGGSYGGFMTSWIIGQEDRWKSAVVERGLLAWTSFSGTSDIGGVFAENYLLLDYPKSWDLQWEKSPLALAHGVSTPTLVIHAENDYRCPISQAEQYFMALLRNGTPAELLRFPGEGHEMSRSGDPRHRLERFEAILGWHDRYLK